MKAIVIIAAACALLFAGCSATDDEPAQSVEVAALGNGIDDFREAVDSWLERHFHCKQDLALPPLAAFEVSGDIPAHWGRRWCPA